MVSARASGFASTAGWCDSPAASGGSISGAAASGAVTGIGAVTGATVEEAGGYSLDGDVVEPVLLGVVRKLISL